MLDVLLVLEVLFVSEVVVELSVDSIYVSVSAISKSKKVFVVSHVSFISNCFILDCVITILAIDFYAKDFCY